MKKVYYQILFFLMTISAVSNAQVAANKLQIPNSLYQNNSYGTSVANHGNFTVVGSYFQNRIHLFYLGNYVRSYTITDASGYGSFGISLGISQDFIVAGASTFQGSGNETGAAFVIAKNGNDYQTTYKQKLTPSSKQTGEKYGFDVTVSGNWLAVSAPERNSGRGGVEMFELINGYWWSRGWLSLTHTPLNAQFGYSLSMDGDRIVIGAKREKAIYIFRRNGNTWGFEDKINSTIEGFGHDVDICQREWIKKIIVGAPSNSGNPGVAKIYKYEGLLWRPWNSADKSLKAITHTPHFGYSVAIERAWAVVGEPYAAQFGGDTRGEVYHFANEGEFNFKGTLYTGDGDKNTGLGFAVDIQDQWVVATDKDYDGILSRSGSEGIAYRAPFYHVFQNGNTRISTDNTSDLNFKLSTVYPNPASDVVNISAKSNILTVSATSSTGNVLKLNVENNTVDVSDLSSGIYILTIQTEHDVIIEQLSVK